VTEGRELNTFGIGDGDSDVLWPKQAQKCENFASGIRRVTIYGNVVVIADK